MYKSHEYALELALPPSTCRVVKLERPEEVGSLLEVRADGVDLMDEIFDGEDVELSKSFLNDAVVGQRHALLVDLGIAPLVDEFTDGLQVRLAVVRSTQHLSLK